MKLNLRLEGFEVAFSCQDDVLEMRIEGDLLYMAGGEACQQRACLSWLKVLFQICGPVALQLKICSLQPVNCSSR